MTETVIKPLQKRYAEIDRELDRYFEEMERAREGLKNAQECFNNLSEEKSKVESAIRFLEENKEEWYDSNS